MSTAPQPSVTPPDPPTPPLDPVDGGQPAATPAATPAVTLPPTTISPNDRFYTEYPLSTASQDEFEIGDRDVGIVLTQGRKYGPFPPGVYTAPDLLPTGADAGTLCAVRSGGLIVDVLDLMVQSLNRVNIKLALSCEVQVVASEELADERDPHDKLKILVDSAARSVFGRYTSEQLRGSGANPPSSETLIKAIRDTCDTDFHDGRGVRGLRVLRIDFAGGWVMAEAEREQPQPALQPAPPPDDEQLVERLLGKTELLKAVAAACLAEATRLGMLPADADRFDAILDAQAILPRDQGQRLRQAMRTVVPDFKGGTGSGTP
ncbi:MAG: hypothetical protein U0768_16375 [Anaerolineae bacterium]